MQGEEPDEDDAYALMASLKRIYAFYQCHDLNSWNLWDTLFYITRQGMDAHGIPEEVREIHHCFVKYFLSKCAILVDYIFDRLLQKCCVHCYKRLILLFRLRVKPSLAVRRLSCGI